MRPYPAGSKLPPHIDQWLKELGQAVSELQIPTQPHPFYACTVAALPPASNEWQTCGALAIDLNTFVECDGANWRRVDTGAIVA